MTTTEPVVGTRTLTDHGRLRKQQIIDASIALLAERGYQATRISDICERAGVAKGLFYWYFDTKADMFSELVRMMRRNLRRAQADAFTDDADPLARIGQGARASVRFMAEHADYFGFLNSGRADPQIAEHLRSGGSVYLDDVTALVAQAQAVGLIGDVDPRLAAIGVVGTVASFSNAARSGTIDLGVDDLADYVAAWIVKALRVS